MSGHQRSLTLMSPPSPPALPPSQICKRTTGHGFGPLPSQTRSLPVPPPGTQLTPYYPQLRLPYQYYGPTGPVGGQHPGQYHGVSSGSENAPPFYYGAPPHHPFGQPGGSQQGAQSWSYGHYPTGAPPSTFPYPDGMQAPV